MSEIPKLFNTVVQDFRDLGGAIDFADKSALYLSKKKEWSLSDYLLIGFNALNLGFRGYKTYYDADKLVTELAIPVTAPIKIAAPTRIPARAYFPKRNRVTIKRKKQNLDYKKVNGSN